MFNFLKSNKKSEENKPGLIDNLSQRLKKTRNTLTEGLANIFLGKKTIDAAMLEELETRLIVADVGVETTQTIINDLTNQVSRKQLTDPAVLITTLKQELEKILTPSDQPLEINTAEKPFVILMVGVNGSGKTTTIGKLAKKFQQKNKNVLLAAGDTYRAAAIEQLQVWGERNDIEVIAQHSGADSASVIFDAFQAAKSRNADILIADTAGRLHTQKNLMEELKKIKRVLTKIDATAPHEVLLVLDSGIGQNALKQAKEFNDAVGVTGIVLTKLDGTAKGGIIFAIAKTMKLPIRYIGVGESIDDLKPFNAKEFVEALFD